MACGASDDRDKQDKRAIESLVRQQYAAANTDDFDAWSSVLTEAGLQRLFPDAEDRSHEGLRKLWRSHGMTTYVLFGVSDIVVNGSNGAATGTIAIHGRNGDPVTQMIYAMRDRLMKVDDAWKIDGTDWVSPAVPGGTKVVPVKANEFSFDVDTSAMESGTFAIQLKNIGHQTHQIHLARIAPELDIERWIRGEEFSLENVDIGSTSLVAPGESVNVPFSSPLTKGRYVMTCSLPDTDDPAQTPHSEKGMYGEFTVR